LNACMSVDDADSADSRTCASRSAPLEKQHGSPCCSHSPCRSKCL
jgi:hypothetical protein